ncbi:MAG: ABC transporter substrate-binding protein [Myxococcaceae bacterium]
MRTTATILAVFVASGCSFTTAGSFEECTSSEQCGDGLICDQGYCVVNPIPEGCGRVHGRADAPNVIQLGLTFPLVVNGVTDETEVDSLESILLALQEINEREGVGGRPFALHVCDTIGSTDRIKAQADWLIKERGVQAIFSSWSSLTLAVAPVTTANNTLVISPNATTPELSSVPDTNGGSVGLIWRTAPSDAIQGRVITDILLKETTFSTVKKVGILYVDDPYGQGLNEVMFAGLARDTTRGIQTKQIRYPRGGDITTPLAQLDAFDPDLTVLVAFPEDTVRILNAAQSTTHLRKVDGHRWFFTDSVKNNAVLQGVSAKAEIDGAWGTAPAQGAGISFSQFQASFESKFGSDPSLTAFTAHSYDAMYVLALGAAWAVGDGSGEVTGPRIAEGLTKLSSGTHYELSPGQFTAAKAALQKGGPVNVAGASGDLDFDPVTGEAPSPIEVWTIDGNAFKTREAARKPPVN